MTDRLIALLARLYLRKPDLGPFLALRLRDRRALLGAARNELAFRLGWHRGAVLTTLNVELTSRCNVACSYCDTNRALGRPNADLDLDVLARLLERAPGVHTLLPFQWGEPLLYEPLDEAIALATRRGVRTYLTTNGTLLDGDRFVRLARAGLARLTVSLDGDEPLHARTRGYSQAPILRRLAEARRAQRREKLATALDVSMVVDEASADAMDALRSAVAGLCDRVQFIPRLVAGARTRACREPSRGLMVVLSDGTVTTCCADVRGELALGRVDDDTDPRAVYRGEAFVALRRAHARRAFPAPCAGCDEACVPDVSKRFS